MAKSREVISKLEKKQTELQTNLSDLKSKDKENIANLEKEVKEKDKVISQKEE
jgi:hypothetical protein